MCNTVIAAIASTTVANYHNDDCLITACASASHALFIEFVNVHKCSRI